MKGQVQYSFSKKKNDITKITLLNFKQDEKPEVYLFDGYTKFYLHYSPFCTGENVPHL